MRREKPIKFHGAVCTFLPIGSSNPYPSFSSFLSSHPFSYLLPFSLIFSTLSFPHPPSHSFLALLPSPSSPPSSIGSQFIHSSVQRIQNFLTRFKFPADATSTTQNYLHDLLSPRRNRTTIEVREGGREGGREGWRESEEERMGRGGRMSKQRKGDGGCKGRRVLLSISSTRRRSCKSTCQSVFNTVERRLTVEEVCGHWGHLFILSLYVKPLT